MQFPPPYTLSSGNPKEREGVQTLSWMLPPSSALSSGLAADPLLAAGRRRHGSQNWTPFFLPLPLPTPWVGLTVPIMPSHF